MGEGEFLPRKELPLSQFGREAVASRPSLPADPEERLVRSQKRDTLMYRFGLAWMSAMSEATLSAALFRFT